MNKNLTTKPEVQGIITNLEISVKEKPFRAIIVVWRHTLLKV